MISANSDMPALEISDRPMRLEDLQSVAAHGIQVVLSNDATWRQKLRAGRDLLELGLQRGDAIYGVSTGVGYTSSAVVDPDHTHEFAYQIIRQHGCGLGAPFDKTAARAILFARLVSLAKGYSAVRPSLLQALCDLLNHDIVPVIPQLGSVGASGDLTPLSYVAAVLAGEREVFKGDGIQPASAALKDAGLAAHCFVPKESLAIMNGTAVMTAVGGITIQRLDAVLGLCERTTALAVEVLLGRTQAFHPTAHRLKNHLGQIQAAKAIAHALQDSGLTNGDSETPRMVQDPYSLRCAPHVIGAARDALTWSVLQVTNELNSVNDNPIVDPVSGETIFAGNFYGGHLAISMDLLKIAVASVADLLDRQFALLVDSRLNSALPDTLVGYPGCGTKALQLTCSALTARTVQRSGSDTVTSRSTEAHNQDKVSMGLNAALNAAEATDLLQQIVAILMVALSNAAALRNEDKFSPPGRKLLKRVREISPVLEFDRRLDLDLNRLTSAIAAGLI